MKKFLELFPKNNLTEQEYRELPYLSYSKLSQYDREGFDCIRNFDKEISSPSLLYGSMVDCIATIGEDTFRDKYIPINFSLSDAITEIICKLADQHAEPQLSIISDEDILTVLNQVWYQTNWKDATRVSKIRELGSEYYNFIKANNGVQPVSQQDYDDAIRAYDALINDSFTAKYFLDPNEFDTFEIFNQLKIVGSYNDIPFKGMLDIVLVDHKNKLIVPCDLKTTKSIYTFKSSFYKYRYYLQAHMYTDLLKQSIQNTDFQDYSVGSYKFIAIDRVNFKPVIFDWVYNEDLVDSYNEPLRTYKELLIDLNWCLDNLNQCLPRDWYKQMIERNSISLN